MKKLYEVANVYSGLSLGFIAAESEKEALDLVSKDAGYESYERACDATGTDELIADEMSIEDLVDLVKGWVDQLLEDDPDFRCMTQSELSKIIVNSNAPAFPTLPVEFVDDAHDIAWDLFIEHWRDEIIDEFMDRGLDLEVLDPTGVGVDDWVIWRVLEGTSITDAVRDWVDWKRQDILEREEEDDAE